MVCKYFAQEVGNKYDIGVGDSKIAEIWFKSEGESDSPFSKTEAENIALKIVARLNEEHPISDEMAEEYGDSDDVLEKLGMVNKIIKGEASPFDLMLKCLCEEEEE